MSARVQSSKIAFGKKKQADIATATPEADMFSFTKLNSSLAAANLGIESDAPEYGKGNEFASAIFATAWEVTMPIEKYGSSQFLAWLWSFGLGNSVMTGAGPYTYTITPIVPSAGLELPYFTYVEQIPSTDDDQMAVGCAIEELSMTINSGPGRQNCKVQATAAGSGRITSPSGITVPAPTTEVLLPAGIATLSILGTDYVANKSLVSLTMGWKNNLLLPEGFFPGSGFQIAGDATSGQVRGRMEIGSRVPTLDFTVRVSSSSTEAAQLAARTTGTCVLTLPVSAGHSFSATWQKVAFKVVSRTDTNGIATIRVQCEPMYDATNGILTVVVATDVQGICQ